MVILLLVSPKLAMALPGHPAFAVPGQRLPSVVLWIALAPPIHMWLKFVGSTTRECTGFDGGPWLVQCRGQVVWGVADDLGRADPGRISSAATSPLQARRAQLGAAPGPLATWCSPLRPPPCIRQDQGRAWPKGDVSERRLG